MKEQNQQATVPSISVSNEAKVENGYGACSASGCNCQSYGGSGDTCSNCGHNYATHW